MMKTLQPLGVFSNEEYEKNRKNLKLAMPKSKCILKEDLTYSLATEEFYISERNQIKRTISFQGQQDIRHTLQQGYDLDKSWLYCTLSYGIMTLTKLEKNKKLCSMVVVDLELGSVISCMREKVLNLPNSYEDVEIHDFAVSDDLQTLAVSYGVLEECSQYTMHVFVQDVKHKDHLNLIQTETTFPFALAFVPGEPCLTIAGMLPGRFERTLGIQTISLKLLQTLNAYPIDSFVNPDAEVTPRLSYSKDGKFLVLQFLESLSISHDVGCESYLMDTSTFQVVKKCVGTLHETCHSQCLPLVKPVFSSCGTLMVLKDLAVCGAGKFVVYKLPCQLNLQFLCRAAILKTVYDFENIKDLNIPKSIAKFLYHGKK